MKPARMLKNLLYFVIIFVFIFSNNCVLLTTSCAVRSHTLRELSSGMPQGQIPKAVGDALRNIALSSSKSLFSDKTEYEFAVGGIKVFLIGNAGYKIEQSEDGNILSIENNEGVKLVIEERFCYGKSFMIVGDSAYPVLGNKVDINKLNPIGNKPWFDFFKIDPNSIKIDRCQFHIPLSGKESDIIPFPVNSVIYQSLTTEGPFKKKEGERFYNAAKTAILFDFKNKQETSETKLEKQVLFIHYAACLARFGDEDDYELAQDFLTWVSKQVNEDVKKKIIDLKDWLLLSKNGCSFEKYANIREETQQLKEAQKKTGNQPSARTLTIYEKPVKKEHLGIQVSEGQLANIKVGNVDPLKEKDIPFVQCSWPKTCTEKLQQNKNTLIPLLAGLSSNVKMILNAHKLTHPFIKIVVEDETGNKTEEWMSISHANIAYKLAVCPDDNIIIVTSRGGTEEGEPYRTQRQLMKKYFPDELVSGRIKFKTQRISLGFDSNTLELSRFPDGHLVTSMENHLWGLLSVLMDKDLVIELLEKTSGIIFFGNGDNIFNISMPEIENCFFEARERGQMLGTIATVTPTAGDKQIGIPCLVTYVDKNTDKVVDKQIRIVEAGELATRNANKTGWKSVDFKGYERDPLYQRLDREKQFIEDINPFFANVAWYGLDLFVWIKYLADMNSNLSIKELIRQLKEMNTQRYVELVQQKGDKVNGMLKMDKSVPDERCKCVRECKCNLKVITPEYPVQDLCINESGKIKTKIIAVKRSNFIPYKGKKQFVLDEQSNVIKERDDTGKLVPKEDYDAIASQLAIKGNIEKALQEGKIIPFSMIDGKVIKKVVKVIPITFEEMKAEIERQRQKRLEQFAPKSSSTGNVCKKFQEPNETIIQKFAQAV